MHMILTGCILLGSSALAAAQSPISSEVIHRSTQTIADQPIHLPEGGVEVTASLVTVQPGAALPIHQHPNVRYGYILTGSLTITNFETGKTMSFGKGEFIIESIASWHSGANEGAVPVTLLVIDQARPGEQSTLLQKP
jgi:quercetin dioxygenase-like cupin family protein